MTHPESDVSRDDGPAALRRRSNNASRARTRRPRTRRSWRGCTKSWRTPWASRRHRDSTGPSDSPSQAGPPSRTAPRRCGSCDRHYKLVILSNVSRAGFAASNMKLGVPFDAVYTAEDIGSYKPSPANFGVHAGPSRERARHRPRRGPAHGGRACFTTTLPRRPSAFDGVDRSGSDLGGRSWGADGSRGRAPRARLHVLQHASPRRRGACPLLRRRLPVLPAGTADRR